MPPTDTTTDRVMMTLANKISSSVREQGERHAIFFGAPGYLESFIAAALSSHGLREFVLAARDAIDESHDEPLSLRLEMALRRLDASFTALLGEGE